ncbi:MAG: DUF4386 family protein [Chloroflexi bacterium]|nr:DUF4386 family protein [Chloroflexota bacterium]
MLTQNTIERTCGVLLIALAVAVVATAAIGSQFETYDKSFDEALQKVADNPGLFKLSLVSSFVAGLVAVALACTMYLAYRGHGKPMALLGAVWLLAFSAAMVGASVAGSAVLHMADHIEKVVGADTHNVAAGAQAVGAMAHNIAVSARPVHILRESSGIVAITVFLPLATLTFGVLIVASRAVPGWLGWLAVVAGAAMLAFWVPVVGVGWAIFLLGTLLALIWLVVLGGWMLVRGTNEPRTQQRGVPMTPLDTAPSGAQHPA